MFKQFALSVFFFTALVALPAQASFIQELFDSSGTKFGELEFATTAGSDIDTSGGITDLISASVVLGGITFTADDAIGSAPAWEWSGVDTNTASIVLAFSKDLLDGFVSFAARYIDGAEGDVGTVCAAAACGTGFTDAAFSTLDSSTAAVRVPIPATVALLLVGLAGAVYSRKRFSQAERG
jgi:hypothetical protein